jgi:hypothetical protein
MRAIIGGVFIAVTSLASASNAQPTLTCAQIAERPRQFITPEALAYCHLQPAPAPQPAVELHSSAKAYPSPSLPPPAPPTPTPVLPPVADSSSVLDWCRQFRSSDPACMVETTPQYVSQWRQREAKENAELRRRIQSDGALGYSHRTLKELSERTPEEGAAVAIPAHVRDAYTIVDNSMVYRINGVRDVSSNKYEANIILGTAPQVEVTKILSCIDTYYLRSNGTRPCAMMIRGRLSECTKSYYGVEKNVVCIAVESAWLINDVGTFDEVVHLKLKDDLPDSDLR